MQNDDLLCHIDFLLSAALKKCGRLEDARDLAQETLLSAIACRAKGGEISDPRGWLVCVLHRKHCDMLRRKYRLPTVTIGEGFDLPGDDGSEGAGRADEEAAVRREVARLSEAYRAIIARHYFHGERVEDIAIGMGIPVGTVKSRLAFGRKQLRKGLDSMEHYAENSFMPQRLHIANSGRCGFGGEPQSLVPGEDLLAQNLLLLAYERPVTVTELSKAIGIPAAYLEPVIGRLVNGELIRRMGDGRIYTDFIIYDRGDEYAYVREQEQFASAHSGSFLPPMQEAIDQLKKTPFYGERLERYMLIDIARKATWDSLQPHIKPQVFPDRADGGQWIAFGYRSAAGYRAPEDKKGRAEYGYSGERQTEINSYLGSGTLEMRSYETSLYPLLKYDGFGYTDFFEMEADLLRLFYLIEKGIQPEAAGFPEKMLKNMPLLIRRGFVGMKDGRPELLAPRLTHAQYAQYGAIVRDAGEEAADKLTAPMGEYLSGKRKRIPPHLKSVPEQKLTMPYEVSPICLVYEAVSRGLHRRDLGFPCPETLAVFD